MTALLHIRAFGAHGGQGCPRSQVRPASARDAAFAARARGSGRVRSRGRHFLLVAALLADAGARRALLRRLLKHEGRVALRAGLGHGLVPVDRVALRVLRAAVEVLPALRLLHDYLALAARLRAGNAGRLALDVLARRVVRARDELAERAVAADE